MSWFCAKVRERGQAFLFSVTEGGEPLTSCLRENACAANAVHSSICHMKIKRPDPLSSPILGGAVRHGHRLHIIQGHRLQFPLMLRFSDVVEFIP